MYASGRGDKGQLGVGYASHREFRPISMKGDLPIDKIKQIACGMHQTLVLTQKGQVYACGLNNIG